MPNTRILITPRKTYATVARAEFAASQFTHPDGQPLHYLITCTDEGRFYPIFVGERAVTAGVHFTHCVVS